MYKQLVSPDLNTVGLIGWCLKFVEDAYHTPHLGATATDAWHATQFPHTDALPTDVNVPVWFSYYEDGLNFGHVAIHMPDGRVLSSPYKQNNTQQWFSSIGQCEQVLNCKYVGWSEDLATIKLVEEGNMASTVGEEEFHDLFVGFFGPITDQNPVWDSDRKAWIGAETNTVIRQMFADPRQQAYANSHNSDTNEYEVYVPPTQYIKKGSK